MPTFSYRRACIPANENGLLVEQSRFTLKVTSSAFRDGGKIPAKYTCDGSNMNPPLRIDNFPKAAKSLVLIADDPDAPGRAWIHWLVWNIASLPFTPRRLGR